MERAIDASGHAVIRRLVAISTEHARLVLLIGIVGAVLGAFGWRALGRDAIPDLSDPQIAIVVDWMMLRTIVR